MIQKFIICFCIAMTFVAQALQAEQIPVRSGLHEGFVRIALDVPIGTKWTLQNSYKTAKISLANHNDGFDLSRAIRRIDGGLVTNLKSTASELHIRFNCDCQATAFRQGDRMIVLDIAAKENAPDELGEGNAQITLPTIMPMVVAGDMPLTFREQFPARSASPMTTPPTRTRQMQSEGIELGFDAIVEVNESRPIDAEALTQTRKKLTKSIGTAATQGILRPNRFPIDLPNAVPRPQIDVRIFDSSEQSPVEEELQTAPVAGHLIVSSSTDVPFSDAEPEAASTTMGIQCIDPTRVAVSAWGSGAPMMAKVSKLRKTLYSEFDKLQREVALDLARTYLHHGFGSEARQVLSLDEELVSSYPELLEISDIMEFGRSTDTDFLQNFMECDSEAALWAILAAPTVPASQSINEEAALRTLTSLPVFLRGFIAPELSQRLLEYGAPDSAAAALRTLERMAQPLNSAANLARADLDLVEENIEQAQSLLADVVASNEQQSAEALIKFVDSHLATDTVIEENVATLVEAYALEMRDHPIGEELQRTHVIALAKSGQFDRAFEALHRIRDPHSENVKLALDASLFKLLTKNADDIVFLDHTFTQLEKSGSWDDPNINLVVAERLISLGFTHQAEAILMAHSELSDSSLARLLRSRIALAQNRPIEAEALTFGITSIDADRLRAEANLQMGNYAQAQAMFLRLGDKQKREHAIWLSDNWTDLESGETSVFSSVARLASIELSNDPDIEGMLARTSSSVAESAQAREIINSLLQAQSKQGKSSQ